MSKTNTNKTNKNKNTACYNEDIKAIKKVLIKFIKHIKHNGKLRKFDPDEADELIDIVCNWIKENQTDDPMDT